MTNKRSVLRTGIKKAIFLGGIALVAGGIAGWAGLIQAQGVDARAAFVAALYPSLLVLLPGALLLSTWMGLKTREKVLYQNPVGAVVLLVSVGAVGAVLGTLTFVAAATQVSAVIGQMDPAQFQQALYSQAGWWQSVRAAISVTIVSALVIAFLVRMRSGR
jgi:TctA family transporter